MNKTKKSIGLYLTLVAGIIAIVEAIYYGQVMYTYQPVYYFLAAAIVLAVLSFVLVGFNKVITGFIPVVNAVLMASAAVWSASVMVNQIGYVVSGLDGIDTIMSFIIFSRNRRETTCFRDDKNFTDVCGMLHLQNKCKKLTARQAVTIEKERKS